MYPSLVSLAYLFTGLYSAVADSSTSIVDVGYAKYKGNRTQNSVAYLGVPYAEPPLGDLRFRAPLPLNTSRVQHASGGSIIDATQYPEFCIQGTTGSGDAGGAGSEDCLKINIYAPADATSKSKLPVLVYIHGGGFVYGNPRNWPFDHWIQQSPNVVIVSVYYRLDSFGFLAAPELTDSANGDLNAGFKDQIEALRWVKNHISAFGGDSNKVTINGESAGGASVELHLVANEKEKLFRSAIAQSVYRTPVPTSSQQVPLFEFYASEAGCGSGSFAQKIACLRKASISALARAQDAARTTAFNGSYNLFHPVLEDSLLPKYPTKSILSDQFAHVPLIVGATTNETLSGGNDIGAALKKFFPALTENDIEDFEAKYAHISPPALRFQDATGESELKCAGTIMGRAFSRRVNTWTYRYNQPNPTGNISLVSHAAENWMMFLGSNTGVNGTVTFTEQTPSEHAFAAELIAYWLSFVRSGNPNTHKLPKSPVWNQYKETSRSRIVLQEDLERSTKRSGSFVELVSADETDRCNFVASKVESQQN